MYFLELWKCYQDAETMWLYLERMYVNEYEYSYFQELVHVVMEASKHKAFSVGQQFGHVGKS